MKTPPDQKFPSGTRVRLLEDWGELWALHKKGAVLIIEYSYVQKYGYMKWGSTESTLYACIDEKGLPLSWVHESILEKGE